MMKPFTKEEVLRLDAAGQDQELFERLIEHVATFPTVLDKLTDDEKLALLRQMLLRGTPNNGPAH